MTGFIRGLFSKKSDQADAPAPKAERPKVERPKKESKAYYLDADSSQTYGNSEYMRTSKKTKRTFPKTAAGQVSEYVHEVSAMGRVIGDKIKDALSTDSPSETPQIQPPQVKQIDDTATKRRKPDSNMDTFRKMAKDIRK